MLHFGLETAVLALAAAEALGAATAEVVGAALVTAGMPKGLAPVDPAPVPVPVCGAGVALFLALALDCAASFGSGQPQSNEREVKTPHVATMRWIDMIPPG
jgi:hypothetical protein